MNDIHIDMIYTYSHDINIHDVLFINIHSS